MKYNISKQFGIFRYLKPPYNKFIGKFSIGLIKNCYKCLNRKKGITYTKYQVDDFDIVVARPKTTKKLGCLVFYHGGAFSFPAFISHYNTGVKYIRGAHISVAFVNYRLSGKHPFPAAENDCLKALSWVYEKAQMLNIDTQKIGIVGDSAGGNLCAKASMYAKQQGLDLKCQMYVYPVIDPNALTNSKIMFTDTPCWNSKLNVKMWDLYFDGKTFDTAGYKCILDDDFTPHTAPSYVETCEFDCLNDEGKLFYDKLKGLNIDATYTQIKGAMHGFDMIKCQITTDALLNRINFLKKYLG